MMKKTHRFLIATSLVASALLPAAPALASSTNSATATSTTRNGSCDAGEFCLYYYADFGGSVSDFSGTVSISNYGASEPTCYDYKGVGDGRWTCVKNNAESVWNRSSHAIRIYYNSGFSGAYQTFSPGQYGNLNSSLWLNNACHKVL